MLFMFLKPPGLKAKQTTFGATRTHMLVAHQTQTKKELPVNCSCNYRQAFFFTGN